MRWIAWIAVGLAVAFVVATALFVWAIESSPAGPPSTDTTSSQFADLEARHAFLADYLGPMPYANLEVGTSPDSALAFTVVYRNNNSGMVPGPSDWTMQVLARVPPGSLEVWLRGLQPVDSLDTRWLRDLEPGPRADGLSEWYGGPSRMVGFDRQRGIVAYRATTM